MSENSVDDDLILDLLLAWEDSLRSTSPKSAEELCGGRTDLVQQLKQQMQALTALNGLLYERQTDPSKPDPLFDSASVSVTPEIPGFVVLDLIGRGGMGVVYKALQRSLNRKVALKVIKDGWMASAKEISRLRREAKILARLQIPGVVQILDVVEQNQVLCLVIEFVSGKNLWELSSQTPVEPDRAARIARDIAETMISVHSEGILHRDIKPANVLIDAQDHVKITDFGLAILLNSGQSVSGEIVGSPNFMAPEQTTGNQAEISVRTDVYSIGATLYHLLTSRPPFAGATTMETLQQVLKQEPIPPRQLVGSVPQDLETICLKCLEKEPARRYATAADLRDDLDRFLQRVSIVARPVSASEKITRWCYRYPDKAALTAFSCMVTLLLVVGLTWYSARLQNMQRLAHERELASQKQEFYARWGRIRDRGLRRPTGWLNANLDEIRAAMRWADNEETRRLLRTEAINCLCSYDVVRKESLLSGVDISRFAQHPTRPLLAAGDNRSDDDLSIRIRLIDTNTFEQLPMLQFPVATDLPTKSLDGCRSLIFTADGKRLLVGSRRGWVHVWETDTWNLIDSWRADDDWIVGIAVDPNGQSIYTSSKVGSIKKWDSTSHTVAKQTKVTGEVFGMFLVADQLVVSAVTCVLVEKETFESHPIFVPTNHSVAISVPAFDETGIFIAHKGRIRHFDISSGRTPIDVDDFETRKTRESLVRAAARDRLGRFLITTDHDTSLNLWDITSRSLIAIANVGDEGGKSVEFLSSGNQFVTASQDRIDLYEIQQHPAWTVRSPRTQNLRDACLAPDGSWGAEIGFFLGTRNSERIIRTWNTNSGTEREFGESSYVPDQISICPSSGQIVVACHDEQMLRVFDPKSMASIREIPCGPDAESLTFSPDGKHLFFVADDLSQTVLRRPPSALFDCDIQTGKTRLLWSNIEAAMQLNRSQILSISPRGELIASSARDGKIRIHSIADGSVKAELPISIQATHVYLLSESRLIIGDDHGRVRLVSLPNGFSLNNKAIHVDEITGMAVDDSRTTLVTSCRNGKICLWTIDAKNDNLIPNATIDSVQGPIQRLALSGDGNTLMLFVETEATPRVLRLDLVRAELQQMGLDWHQPSDY